MSANQKPIAVKVSKETLETRRGTLYYTIGTQQMDADGNFFIDDTIVKESFNDSIIQTLAEQGTVVILENGVLNDYLEFGFSYIDSNNASTNVVRKLKEAEAAKVAAENKNRDLEARLAAFEKGSATTVTDEAEKTIIPRTRRRGGSNA